MTARVKDRILPHDTGEGYYDNGCSVYPKCLSCPLPRCVLTLKEDVPTMTEDELSMQFRMMQSHGVTPHAIMSFTWLPAHRIEELLA